MEPRGGNMKYIVSILIILLLSCKKRDCDILLQKEKNSWDEYVNYIEICKNNPIEENKLVKEEKYNTYIKNMKEFKKRGCYSNHRF